MKIKQNGKDDLLGSYLRGKIFYTYHNSKWQPHFSKSQRKVVLRPDDFYLNKSTTLNVFMVPDFLPILFAPEDTIYIDSPDGAIINNNGCWSLKNKTLIDRPARYNIYKLYAGISSKKHSSDKPDLIRYHDIDANPVLWTKPIYIHPKVRELARDWCADLLDRRPSPENSIACDIWNQRISMRIKQRLQEKYKYSLDLSDSDPKRDSVEDFLFHMKQGHCEYFATAMTLMCRALDVPARLATGFFIANIDKEQDSLLVRERDAHAWTEVYSSARKQWIVFDSTPIPTSDRKPRLNHWKSFNKFWSSTKFYWYEKITGYDTIIRNAIAKWTKTQIKNVFSGFMSGLKHAANYLWNNNIGKVLLPVAIIIPSLILAILAYHFIRFIMDLFGINRQKKIVDHENVSWKQLNFTRKLFGIFHECGFQHWPEQSLRSWAMEAAYELDLPVQTVEKLVGLYYSIRWGHNQSNPQQLDKAQQQVEKLAEMIKQRQQDIENKKNTTEDTTQAQ